MLPPYRNRLSGGFPLAFRPAYQPNAIPIYPNYGVHVKGECRSELDLLIKRKEQPSDSLICSRESGIEDRNEWIMGNGSRRKSAEAQGHQ